jgi:transaldolase
VRIFLDTANIEHIRQAARLGVVSGITTNPTLVSKEGAVDYEATVKEICSIIGGPVSAEVVVEGADAMIEQARRIAAWAPNVVIKIPATADGLAATSALAKNNIKVNFTLCFSVNQALLGARAGAAYVSPFVGRLDDIGADGMQLVRDIVEVYKNYPDLHTEVIAASIRHPQHCVVAARAGAHIATIPYDVLMQMIRHPLTDIGISRFMADWQRISPALGGEGGKKQ